MSSLLVFFVSAAFLLQTVQSTCAHGTTLHRRESTINPPTFSYSGITGPLNWHGISSSNSICATGTHQSPINIHSSTITKVPGSTIKVDIPNSDDSEFLNLGTTIEVLVNGSLELDGKSFSLKQFHFHSPSEHLIDDHFFPMETHFVFQAQDKSLAVIGFPISFGSNDPLLGNVLNSVSQIPSLGNTTILPELSFVALKGHFQSHTVFRYNGSLTTPPCSEGVQWLVSSQPITIDAPTFLKTKDVIGFNSRFDQGETGEANLIGVASASLAKIK